MVYPMFSLYNNRRRFCLIMLIITINLMEKKMVAAVVYVKHMNSHDQLEFSILKPLSDI